MRHFRTALLAIVMAAATAFILAGCGDPGLTGVIVEMEHDAGTTSCGTKNGKYTCSTKPGCFEVEVREDNGNTGDVCVSRSQFEKLKVGDRVTNLK